MKLNNIFLGKCVFAASTFAAIAGLTACEDFLDREPMGQITPETAFTTSDQLAAYSNPLYTDILPSHENWTYGIYGKDKGTDNQTEVNIEDRFTKDRWKVANTDSTNWKFGYIYDCNLFFQKALPKFGTKLDGSENTISGNLQDIRHYIGEMYFLRACEYFNRYQMYGDFPIITTPIEENSDSLRIAGRRQPRNKVARFILSDLDKAIELLSGEDLATTRINKDAALLLKSRVALFEGTWLKYFKGTAFVPGGEGWPGANKEWNKNFTIDIDSEIDFFLTQAMEASEQVADKYKDKLTQNTGELQQDANGTVNPYYEMFCQENLSDVPEVLLWRQYARGIETHNVNTAAGRGNYQIGLTRGFVQNFLMADGTPVYTHGTYSDGDGYYMGDKLISNVRQNRDTRLSIFLKEPGQKNILYELDNNDGTEAVMTEPYPSITNGDKERGYATGYALRKGGNFNRKYYINGGGWTSAISYRASEALLNYMEASYLKEKQLNTKAREYWQALRRRAGVSEDIDKTIAQTVMAKEAENDWAAYSGNDLVDPTLYNIRRERRCEMMAEGLRYMDLCRWRAMDHLISTPYHLEGIHLWNTPMEAWYNNSNGETTLVADGSSNANVSSKTRSEYLRPFERQTSQAGFDGMTWNEAHYLLPVPIKQMQLTATDPTDLSTSTTYQNPYWPTTADQAATK